MMYKYAILSLFLALQWKADAQNTDSIPFVLTPYNNIYVQAVLNDQDSFKLMYHTGAHEVSLTEAAFEPLKYQKKISSTEGKAWGGTGTSRYFDGNQIQIGQSQWDSLRVWVSRHSGHLTDGKFGPTIFNEQCIEINFDQQQFIVYRERPSKKTLKQYKRFKLSLENDLIFITGILKIGKKKYKHKFMLHTGYSGAILLDDAFAKQHTLGNELEIISESELKDSYGNVLVTKKAIVPSFKLGASTFQEMPLSFFEGAIGRQKVSVLGGALFKRFNSILDLKNGYIYLKENKYSALPFDHA